MKLLKLELCNFRGARTDLSIEPNGENMIILGPNGTGKSTLVDAIDFLLSGTIDRLLGEGTGGVTLQKHGHHVDACAKDAWVRASVSLPGVSKPITIERKMSNPQQPLVDKQAAAQLRQVFALARNGQHILTRREVLRYITAPPSKRAERIQALLGISEIERVRASLVRVRGQAKGRASETHGALLSAQSALVATTGAEKFDTKIILHFVNVNRQALGVEPIDTLASTDVSSGIALSLVNGNDSFPNPHILERDVNSLKQQLQAESYDSLLATESKLRDAIELVHNQPTLLGSLRAHKLTDLGLQLLDESGACPLCDTEWPAGGLRKHLERKLEEAKAAHKTYQMISQASEAVSSAARIAVASISKVVDAADTIGYVAVGERLREWIARLQVLIDVLQDPVDNYLTLSYSHDQVASLLVDDSAYASIEAVMTYVRERSSVVSPEQTAYELLIRIATEAMSWENARIEDRFTQKTYRRASRLLEAFEHARDDVLSSLYDSVRSRFERLYRQLHAADESGFTSVLEPDGAGVAFEVDYFGRGRYPPTAIHSEGHQDSMGVCLFLALAEYINQGKLQLVVLDDVLMAIDAEHRRAFCQLLKTAFPDRQFLITTHDRLWANQLKHQGVVRSKGFLEISHWDLENGPRINSETDVWLRIEQDLRGNDVSAAAARLRRSSEEFYGQVCHFLKAPVRYDMTGRYDLGDFLDAAKMRYRSLLKDALKSARSWENEELVASLSELEDERQEIFAKLDTEQWAVNPAVHFNSWANFSVADFVPVVEAFRSLQAVFICEQCRSIIRIISASPRSVRCNCNQFNWNLEFR